MAQVEKRFDVSLDIKKSMSNREFEVVEGDTGNILEVTLTDDGAQVDLRGCFIQAVFSKSDGHTASQHNLGAGITLDDTSANAFEILLYPASVAPGMVECEIQVYSKDSDIEELADIAGATLSTSAKFNFFCRRNIANDEVLQNEPPWPLLVSLVESCNEMEEALSDLTATEGTRVAAEAVRIINEDARVRAENARIAAESDRDAAENERASAETARIHAEEARAGAELSRVELANKFSALTVSAQAVETGNPPTATFTLGETQAHIAFGIPNGKSFVILGTYATLSDLTAAVLAPKVGDMYAVGTETPRDIYIWSGSEWTDQGAILGPAGEKGEPGYGIPAGGAVGQYIRKKSATDYDVDWDTPSGAGDMLRTVYDLNGNGIVDNAERLGNQLPSYYQAAITANGLLKGNGSGSISAATAGTDYQTAITASGILKGAGGGSVAAAVAGTDYQTPLAAGTDYIEPPTAVSGTGAVIVTLADNREYTYTGVTAFALTGAAVSCHGFITFAGSTPSISPLTGFSGISGDDITEAAASEVWEFSCERGYVVFKNWSAS